MGTAIQLLVFDLDGTLIDSRLDLATAVNATLASLGREALEVSTIGSFIGDGASMLVQRALQATGDGSDMLVAQAMPRFLHFYRAHMLDHTQVYDGVLEALAHLRQAAPDLLMAVLTNKPVGPSRRICDALHLSSFFFANYGGNSFATKKPDPHGLQTLMLEAGEHLHTTVLPQATVMIGDSDVDVRTARAVGARSLGCTYGLATEALLLSEPDALAATPAHWLQVLGVD